MVAKLFLCTCALSFFVHLLHLEIYLNNPRNLQLENLYIYFSILVVVLKYSTRHHHESVMVKKVNTVIAKNKSNIEI